MGLMRRWCRETGWGAPLRAEGGSVQMAVPARAFPELAKHCAH